VISLDSTEGRQEALIDLGFLAGGVDGIWGAMSKGALVAFQRANDLVPDGVWGKNTERAMVSKLTSGGR
jgi:peptidoglycan hydrolase-like protein with peptidoglycan-binding domain